MRIIEPVISSHRRLRQVLVQLSKIDFASLIVNNRWPSIDLTRCTAAIREVLPLPVSLSPLRKSHQAVKLVNLIADRCRSNGDSMISSFFCATSNARNVGLARIEISSFLPRDRRFSSDRDDFDGVRWGGGGGKGSTRDGFAEFRESRRELRSKRNETGAW